MIWYRAVRQRDISLDSDFLSGEHTRSRIYRWSSRGTAAVYVADSPETAIAECGKYWICDNAERINNSIAEIKGRPPDGWLQQFHSIMNIQAYIADIDIDDTLPCLELSTNPPALAHFASAGFQNLDMMDVRKNAFITLPGKPTCAIGNHYAAKGIPFLKVMSARTDGLCGILYPGNYHAIQATFKRKRVVTMHALDIHGNRIKADKIVKLDQNTFEYEFDGQIKRISPLKL